MLLLVVVKVRSKLSKRMLVRVLTSFTLARMLCSSSCICAMMLATSIDRLAAGE